MGLGRRYSDGNEDATSGRRSHVWVLAVLLPWIPLQAKADETPPTGSAEPSAAATEALVPAETSAPATVATEATAPLAADSEAPAASAAGSDAELPLAQGQTQAKLKFQVFDRYENGLDAELADFFSHKASDLAAPSIMLTAEWLYRFPTLTGVGIMFAGVPQPQGEDVGSVNINYSTYYYGLTLSQAIFESGPYRATVGLSGGKGVLYVRTQPSGQAAVMHQLDYVVWQPSLYVTFAHWRGVDFGVVGSVRNVNLTGATKLTDDGTVNVANSDVSSAMYGLTFRAFSR